MSSESQQIKELEEKVGVLFEALHLLIWDYHNRFHKDVANTGGYRACIEWPCLQFALNIWKHE